MNARPIYYKLLRFFGIERASSELAREQVRILSQQIPILYCVITLNSGFLALASGAFSNSWTALVLPVIAMPIMFIRGAYWRSFAHKDLSKAPERDIRKALKSAIITSNILAVILGVWASGLVSSVPPEYRGFIPLFSILSIITCTYCLNSLPLAAYSVLAGGGSMIIATMWFTGDMMLMALSANIAMVSIVILFLVSKQYRQLRNIVVSRSKIIKQRSYANELAYQDQLTGLPNRRAMIKALNELKNDKEAGSIAMLMLDMNGFKPVNDTYGHAAGDHLLTEVGHRLNKVADESALVARLGGDEFAILVQGQEMTSWVYEHAETILREIGKPVHLEDHELHIGAAIGIATKESVPDDPMELMRHADIALYEAKAKERKQISVFEGDMEARVKRRTLIEQALSDREEMQGINLNYQPIFSMEDGSKVGFEALARWNHPELGQISPTEFVSAAEGSGLAARLTVHLFRQAIDTANRWDDDLKLSFNLSGSGLATSDLDVLLPNIIREKNFEPHRLQVEITETALLGNLNAARRVLSKLRDMGIKIVLDDFGAGYASIGYLREMAFDGIKLDGSLIRDITKDEKSRQLLIGVLHLCRSLGADVTAEMVENEEQLALLRTLPINNLQGYLLGTPGGAEATLQEDEDKQAYLSRLFG